MSFPSLPFPLHFFNSLFAPIPIPILIPPPFHSLPGRPVSCNDVK